MGKIVQKNIYCNCQLNVFLEIKWRLDDRSVFHCFLITVCDFKNTLYKTTEPFFRKTFAQRENRE